MWWSSGLVVRVSASRSSILDSNLGLGPPHGVVWGAADHTVILYKKYCIKYQICTHCTDSTFSIHILARFRLASASSLNLHHQAVLSRSLGHFRVAENLSPLQSLPFPQGQLVKCTQVCIFQLSVGALLAVLYCRSNAKHTKNSFIYMYIGWLRTFLCSVIWRNFREFLISCFAKFTSNSAKFCKRRNRNLGENFAISAKHDIKLRTTFWPFCKKEMIFNFNKFKTLFIFGTQYCVHIIKTDFDICSFGAKKFCFPDFLKSQK